MKSPIVSVLLFISAFCLLRNNKVQAQNIQLFYDTGRDCVTSTVEMFRTDAGGSTFFFVDFDYSPKVTGAYWEFAREFNFWQNSKLSWLSVHIEYNGGLTNTISYNNAFLGGLTYSGHSANLTKFWSLSAMYKAIPGMKDVFGRSQVHTFQITGVCEINFAKRWCTFCSYFDFSREVSAWQETEYIFVTEPQIWVNLNKIKGWENVNLSLGSELKLSANYIEKGLYAMPAVGVKWTF